MKAFVHRYGVAVAATVAAGLVSAAIPAAAQKKYDPGASDSEIKVGNINPYSGPASAYGLIGKTIEAYFKKVNADGGINGRKINFISYDDGYCSIPGWRSQEALSSYSPSETDQHCGLRAQVGYPLGSFGR